jgi:hypothetical protein
MSNKRKQYSPAFKAKVALDTVRGEKTSYAHFWCMEGKEGRAYPAG